MQLEDELGIAKSLENFEKIWTFPLMNYQKKKLFLWKNVTPYMNRRSLIPLGSLYFLTQNFKNNLDTLDYP